MLTRIASWYLKRKRRKQVKKQMKKKKREVVEIYKNLKRLYHFINWLNKKGLKNRKEKKAFYKKVLDGEPVAEKIVKDMAKKYKDQIVKNSKKSKADAIEVYNLIIKE